MQIGFITMTAAAQCRILLLVVSIIRATSLAHGPAPSPSLAASPASAPSPAISTASVEWDVENLNYYDLTKPWDETDENAKNLGSLANKPSGKSAEKPSGAADELSDVAESVNEGLANVADGKIGTAEGPSKGELKNAAKDVEKSVDGAMPDIGDTVDALPGVALLANQVSVGKPEKVTVQNALRKAIEGAVKTTVCNPLGQSASPAPALVLSTAPAPAPAPTTATLNIPPPVNAILMAVASNRLRGNAPAPASAMSPASASCPQPKVHVAFSPGRSMEGNSLLAVQSGARLPPRPIGTRVKVSMFDRPGNALDDLAEAKAAMHTALANGVFMGNVHDAFHDVLPALVPKIVGLKIQNEVVKAWDIAKCESHMSTLVRNFTVHYTKRQVPMALYNECTDFTTKISFSHDYILDPQDAARCRSATKSFALKWKLGKNNDPKYFEEMCLTFCEAKFGNDAPLCHITAGDKLGGAPL
jgi:hypothetical protein